MSHMASNFSFLRAFQYMERFGDLYGCQEDEVEAVNEDASAVATAADKQVHDSRRSTNLCFLRNICILLFILYLEGCSRISQPNISSLNRLPKLSVPSTVRHQRKNRPRGVRSCRCVYFNK